MHLNAYDEDRSRPGPESARVGGAGQRGLPLPLGAGTKARAGSTGGQLPSSRWPWGRAPLSHTGQPGRRSVYIQRPSWLAEQDTAYENPKHKWKNKDRIIWTRDNIYKGRRTKLRLPQGRKTGCTLASPRPKQKRKGGRLQSLAQRRAADANHCWVCTGQRAHGQLGGTDKLLRPNLHCPRASSEPGAIRASCRGRV